MFQMLLGVVDSVGVVKSGPGARLRPLLQASTDKTRWNVIQEDEFPNSGVVSWWVPSPEAEVFKVWIFHVEGSRTFESGNRYHDLYGVKGFPSLAIELVDLPLAADPEDTRAFLLEEGLPLERCVTKRFVFRDRSGLVVGPLELLLREGRLFLDERDTLIPLNQPNADLDLGEWDGHRFLPPENCLRRVGEVDFSRNAVFLRRVLREIREMPPNAIENAKLTEKLIGSYTAALEKTTLTTLQAQRLKRLRKMAEQAAEGIVLVEDSMPDLLSLAPVQHAISCAIEEAVRDALVEGSSALKELEKRRVSLELEIANLGIEAGREYEKIESLRNEQANLLASFDSRVQKKFDDVKKDASSFLADVAVIRAALSGPPQYGVEHVMENAGSTPRGQLLTAAQLVDTVRQSFKGAGLGCTLPATILSAWAAGCVPIAFGAMARDVFSAASDSIFGGNTYFAALGPALCSPTDILSIPAVSSITVKTIGELVRESSCSQDMALLVFENINLCQLDSTLMPLLRSYSGFHVAISRSQSVLTYPSPLGIFPANLLFAGILVDSPLALPLSPELWNSSVFVDASGKRSRFRREGIESSSATGVSRLLYEAWIEWLRGLDQSAASDTRLIALHAAREIESDSQFKRMTRLLASAIDQTASSSTESERAGLLVEMAIVPYLVSRGLRPEKFLETAPVEVVTEDNFINILTALFQKWGLSVGLESEPGS